MRTAVLALALILLVPCPGPAATERVVVLNSADGDVSLIDPVTYQQVKRIPVGKEPHHLMATPDERHLLVANAMSNDMVLLDRITGELVRRIPRISDPYQIGLSPDHRWFVVNSLRLDRVDIYEHRGGEFTLASRRQLGRAPSHLAFTSDSRTVFVTLQDTSEVAALDLVTGAVRWTVPTGPQPAGAWVTPGDRHLLVGITGGDHVEARDPQSGSLLARLSTGKGAHNFLPMGDGRRVLVSNRVANTISIIDQADLRVLESFPVPGGPDCMELRRDGTELWVTSRWINRVSVVDMETKRVVRSIRVGRSPHGIYFASHAPRR